MMSFGCWRGSAVAVSDPAQKMGAVVHHVEDQPDLGRPDLLGFTAPEYRSVRATEAAPFTEAADAERSLAAVGARLLDLAWTDFPAEIIAE
jgi:hypothetical protein